MWQRLMMAEVEVAGICECDMWVLKVVVAMAMAVWTRSAVVKMVVRDVVAVFVETAWVMMAGIELSMSGSEQVATRLRPKI